MRLTFECFVAKLDHEASEDIATGKVGQDCSLDLGINSKFRRESVNLDELEFRRRVEEVYSAVVGTFDPGEVEIESLCPRDEEGLLEKITSTEELILSLGRLAECLV